MTGPKGDVGPAGTATPVTINQDIWHLIGTAGEPAFQNAWVNHGAAGSPAGFRKTPDGRVSLQGLIKSGTVDATDTQPTFTLPAGYRPSATQRFPAPSAGLYGQVDITAAGLVVVAKGTNSDVDLAGIEFDTGQTTATVGQSAAATIEAYHLVGATGEPAFQNGWVNYDPSFTPLSFRKDPAGQVAIRGMVKSGSIPATIFTLPTGYRPPGSGTTPTMLFDAISVGGQSRIDIAPNGTVTMSSGQNGWFSLDGIFFDTDQTTWPSGPQGPQGPQGPAGAAGTLQAGQELCNGGADVAMANDSVYKAVQRADGTPLGTAVSYVVPAGETHIVRVSGAARVQSTSDIWNKVGALVRIFRTSDSVEQIGNEFHVHSFGAVDDTTRPSWWTVSAEHFFTITAGTYNPRLYVACFGGLGGGNYSRQPGYTAVRIERVG
jgi:hypothetical protein